MSFANTFDGTSLGPTWTLEAGTPAATLEVADGECRITAKPGASYEAPSQTSPADTSFGIVQNASDAGIVGDFDIAVQAPTSLLSWPDNGWGIALFGANRPSNHIVVEQRHVTLASPPVLRLRILRRVADALTVSVDDAGAGVGLRNRGHQFIRITRSGNDWTIASSFDGASWGTVASFTAAITLDTIKIYGTTFDRDLGMTLRITRTYDVTGNDLREAAGTLSGATTWSTDFTSGIPSWLVDESANGGAVSVDLSNQLNLDKTTANSSSAFIRNDTRLTDVDMLVKWRINAADVNGNGTQFFVLGIQGRRKADQYSYHRSHILEIPEEPGGDVIPLRVHVRTRNTSDFNAPYDFGPVMAVSGWANDAWLWARFQRIGNRIRFRGWADGNPEPSTWDYDAHDELWTDPGYIWIAWASNEIETAATTALVDELTITGVEAADPEPIDTVDAVPNLVGRWRADVLDGVADLADVEGWADLSDYEMSLWPFETDRPVFHLSEFNGHPAVKFDALAAQRLFGAQFYDLLATDFSALTWVVVCRFGATTGTQVVLDGDVGRNAVFLASGTYQYFAGTVVDSGDAADTGDHVLTTTFAASRASSAQYLDGTQIGTGDPGANILDRVVVGAENSGANPADVYIAEIQLFAGELDADQRAIVHSYVQDRYAVTVSDYVQFVDFGRAVETEIARPFSAVATSTGSIIDAVVAPNGGQQSLPQLTAAQAQGRLLIVAAADRSGGNSASFIAQDAALDNAVALAHAKVTLASQSSNRRSVYVFAGVIPEGVTSNLIDVDVSGGSPVNHGWVAAIIDVTAASLVAVADDDSGNSDVASQGTGTTPQVAAGDVVLVAAEVARGNTTAAWATTDNTPPNPAGGDWDLSIPGGSDTDLHLSMGLAYLTAQLAQAWSDTVSYGTSRQSSALILVFLIDPTAEAEFTGEGTLTATVSTPGQVNTGIIRGDGTPLQAHLLTASGLVDLESPLILPPEE